ncbi:MAG: SDR family oxidoreductase [Alphaproteobacteria bacterium]|nr:SDR family oxidoreductase [Alphaproteobacteria bacterium]
MSKNKLFCFGYGYTCDYLGHDLLQRGGWDVAGTTRDLEKRDLLKKRGIEGHLFDWETPLPDPRLILQDVTHLLISTPPNDDGDPTFLLHSEEIHQLKNLKWIGYLSTTSVYGDRDGEWVDETSELRPSSQRGSRRKKAEDQWLSISSEKLPVHVFRLAGIYGPGRSALDSIRAGMARRIEKPGHAFSRIHVEDIVNVLLASMAKPQEGTAYNVCDDQAAPSHEIIAYACELIGRPPPPLIPFDQADLSPMARSFYSDNKRLHNDKIKNELGVKLKYPTYKEGLKACQEAEDYALSIFKSMG